MPPDSEAINIRLRQILFGLALVVVGYMATRSLMRGGVKNVRTTLAAIAAIAGVLLMDRHYWMLCPLGFWANSLVVLPPLDLSEVGCALVIGVYFVRRALRREEHYPLQPAALLTLLYIAWVAVCYVMNPSGIYSFGGYTIGARFYVKILLGFWAMLVLSFHRLNEDDCRRLFFLGVASGVAALLNGLYLRSNFTESDGTEVSAYELLPAAALFYWLMARYRLRRFFELSWRPVALLILGGITIYTGKRRASANLAIFPLIRAYVTRQDRGPAVFATMFAFVVIGLLVMGQGNLYDLPLSVQRGLSVLPGKWDRRLESGSGGKDLFREIVHAYGIQEIKKSPWVGRKGFAIDLKEIQWMTASSVQQGYEGHAVAANWHSTWIGMWADFGLPAVVGWALFSFGSLLVALRRLRRLPPSSYRHTILVYYSMTIILMLIASRTSGHSALQPFQLWPLFGLMLAVGKEEGAPPILYSAEPRVHPEVSGGLHAVGR